MIQFACGIVAQHIECGICIFGNINGQFQLLGIIVPTHGVGIIAEFKEIIFPVQRPHDIAAHGNVELIHKTARVGCDRVGPHILIILQFDPENHILRHIFDGDHRAAGHSAVGVIQHNGVAIGIDHAVAVRTDTARKGQCSRKFDGCVILQRPALPDAVRISTAVQLPSADGHIGVNTAIE